MSRSRRKTPICGHTYCASDKKFKQKEHRRERRSVKVLTTLERDYMILSKKKWGNPWSSGKDGKSWFGVGGSWTFDLDYYKREMRK